MTNQVIVPPSGPNATSGFVSTNDDDNNRWSGNRGGYGGDFGYGGAIGAMYGRHNDFDHTRFLADFYKSQQVVIDTVNEGSKETAVGIEKTAAAAALGLEKTAAAVAIQVEKTTAGLVLLAVQNAASLAAAMAQAAKEAAECCCETKELIREDGEKTRQLINTYQASNLAVQLVDTKNELLAYRVAGKTTV